MPEAKLHDGATIELEVRGDGPVVLLPVNPTPVEGEQAERMRAWGADPAIGRTLIDGLSDAFRVVAFDYEGHVEAFPKAATLTPENVAADLLAVADAAGAERFAYYGYSWLALSGLQLAIRTDRLSALVMGGFPPIGGPYAEMLAVTRAAHEMALNPAPSSQETYDWAKAAEEHDWDSVETVRTPEQTGQYVTLYEGLRGFDDLAAQDALGCPRLCFAGSADVIEYGEKWGGTRVDIAGPFLRRRAELEALGWDVRVLDGLDHMGAMRGATVLTVLRPWLEERLLGQR